MDLEEESEASFPSEKHIQEGFVSYKRVREAYDSGRSKFGGILFSGSSPTKSERLFMRGPGGCGEVEVAISAVIDQSEEETGPPLPVQISKGSLKMGIGTIVRKAAIAAFASAKHAYVAVAAAKSMTLKCCLQDVV